MSVDTHQYYEARTPEFVASFPIKPRQIPGFPDGNTFGGVKYLHLQRGSGADPLYQEPPQFARVLRSDELP
jgi:hypothetical protein